MTGPCRILDTCCVIDLLQSSERGQKLHPSVRAAQARSVRVLVSEVTVANVCTLKAADSGHTPDQAELLAQVFESEWLEPRPVTRMEALRAAAPIRERKFETCDALIVATGLLHSAQVHFTTDSRLKRRRSRRSLPECKSIESSRVQEPPGPWSDLPSTPASR